jgi:hypothetical protein
MITDEGCEYLNEIFLKNKSIERINLCGKLFNKNSKQNHIKRVCSFKRITLQKSNIEGNESFRLIKII